MFDQYLELGGTEIGNAARVVAYVNKNAPQLPIPAKYRNRFQTLHLALGEDEYESPVVDGAPWLDNSNPATARFYGVIPLAVQGISGSTRQASTTERIGPGGIVGKQRDASRAIRVKALLVAEDELALEAGQTWLGAALQASDCNDHGGSCGGARLCYYAAEPCITDEWETQYQAGFSTPVSTDVAGGRLIIREPNSDALFKGRLDGIAAPPNSSPDGVIVRWGTVRRDATGVEAESYGPIVRRRTNVFPRPNMDAPDAATFWAGSAHTIYTLAGPDERSYMGVTYAAGSATVTSASATPVTPPPGQAIVSLDLRAAAPGTSVTVSLRNPTTPTTVYATATFVVGDPWRRYSFPIADVPTSVMRISGTDTFQFTGIVVEAGTTDFPYLDGNEGNEKPVEGYTIQTPLPVQQYQTEWLGTPNQSASRVTFLGHFTVGMPFGEDFASFGGGTCDVWPFIETLQGEVSGGSADFAVRIKIRPDQQALPYERTMHDVTAVEGPIPIEDLPLRTGGAMRVVEFTLVAGKPYAYSTTKTLLDRQKMSLLPTLPWPGAEACSSTEPAPLIDPDCITPPGPPRPPEIPVACIVNEPTLYRYWLDVDASDVAVWSDMVPRVTIQSGTQVIRQVRVRAFPNPFGRSAATAVGVLRNGATEPKLATDAANWFVGGGTVVRLSNTVTPTGLTWTNRLTVVGAPAAASVFQRYGSNATDSIAVKPGEVFDPGVVVRTSVTRSLLIAVKYYTSAFVQVGAEVVGTPFTNTAGPGWSYGTLGATSTVPATAAYATVEVRGAGATAWAVTQLLEVAGINAQIGPAGSARGPQYYWDGSFTLADTYYRGWAGTPDASVSYATQSPVDPCSWCSEFIVSYLPAHTELTVDAILERAFASVGGADTQPADALLFATDGGPMTWPALSCGIDYLFAFDVPLPLLDDVSITFELARKE